MVFHTTTEEINAGVGLSCSNKPFLLKTHILLFTAAPHFCCYTHTRDELVENFAPFFPNGILFIKALGENVRKVKSWEEDERQQQESEMRLMAEGVLV